MRAQKFFIGAAVVLSAAIITLGAGSVDASAQARSVYTPLEGCATIRTDEIGASVRCPGTAGYSLIVHDYDLRIQLEVEGPRWPRSAQHTLYRLYSSFTSLPARVVEWRVFGGQPYALIARLRVEDPNGGQPTNPLLVFRIDPASVDRSCLIAVIQSGDNNAARRAADSGGGAACVLDTTS